MVSSITETFLQEVIDNNLRDFKKDHNNEYLVLRQNNQLHSFFPKATNIEDIDGVCLLSEEKGLPTLRESQEVAQKFVNINILELQRDAMHVYRELKFDNEITSFFPKTIKLVPKTNKKTSKKANKKSNKSSTTKTHLSLKKTYSLPQAELEKLIILEGPKPFSHLKKRLVEIISNAFFTEKNDLKEKQNRVNGIIANFIQNGYIEYITPEDKRKSRIKIKRSYYTKASLMDTSRIYLSAPLLHAYKILNRIRDEEKTLFYDCIYTEKKNKFTRHIKLELYLAKEKRESSHRSIYINFTKTGRPCSGVYLDVKRELKSFNLPEKQDVNLIFKQAPDFLTNDDLGILEVDYKLSKKESSSTIF